MNYRELVQALVGELGIGGANNSGSVPSTVLGQTGQLANAVRWVTQANNNLNLANTTWKFLHVDYSEALTVGDRNAPAHSGTETIKQWDRSSFWLDLTATTARQLRWMDWPKFRNTIERGSASYANVKPKIFTIKPDNSVVLDKPPDDTYTLTAEGWKHPVLLAADDDEPDIPEEFHRLIICEAAIKYANKEAAAEIIQGMEAEHLYLMSRLESSQLEGHEFEFMGTQDVDLVMDIPGNVELYGR